MSFFKDLKEDIVQSVNELSETMEETFLDNATNESAQQVPMTELIEEPAPDVQVEVTPEVDMNPDQEAIQNEVQKEIESFLEDDKLLNDMTVGELLEKTNEIDTEYQQEYDDTPIEEEGLIAELLEESLEEATGPVIPLPEEEQVINEQAFEEEPASEEVTFMEPNMEENLVEEPIFEEPILEEERMQEPILEEERMQEPVFEEPILEETTEGEEVVYEEDNGVLEAEMPMEWPVEEAKEETISEPEYMPVEEAPNMEEQTIDLMEDRQVSEADSMQQMDYEEVVASDETTVITKGTTINGGIKSDTSLEVKGIIEGDVECLGKLSIMGKVAGNSTASEIYVSTPRLEGNLESRGSIKIDVGTVMIGSISSSSAVISGAVKGDIEVNGPIVIESTAVVKGNVVGKSIQVNSGAVIDGFCSLKYADVDLDSFFE